jgi:hypothetical protein
MADTSSKYLDQDVLLRSLSVHHILDVGYTYHVLKDSATQGAGGNQEEQRVLSDLMNRSSDDETLAEYLRQVKPIVIGYGRALSRCKLKLTDEMNAAETRRRYRLERSRNSNWMRALLRLLVALLGPTIMGVLGYMLAQLAAPYIPTHVAGKTGDELPSILASLVFVFGGFLLQAWIVGLRRGRIEDEYSAHIAFARAAYNQERRSEYQDYWDRLLRIWKMFTGKDYPIPSSTQRRIDDDIATQERFDRQQRVYDHRRFLPLRRLARVIRGKSSRA